MKETKFKQTEVGMIPRDWEVKTLGEIGSFSKGSGISRSESNSGNLPAIRYGEIYTKHNDYIRAFYSHISKDVADKSTRLIQGDVLFSASGETKEDIGKTVAFLESTEAYAGGDIIIMSPKSLVNSMFLGYILNFPTIAKQKAMKAQGDAVVHITTDSLRKLQVSIPRTIKEQQRIANALSDVDTLITNLEKLIAKKKNIKQGAMQQLLTGRKRLPGFASTKPTYKQTELGKIPTDWEVKKIGEFCSVKDGTHGTYARHDKGCLLLSAKNILDNCLLITNDESFVSEKDYAEITANGYPQKGDILVSCVGSIGRCCILETDERIAFQRSVAFVRNRSANTRFLMYAIQGESAQAQLEESKNASTLGGVYLSALADIELILPTSLDEQTAIANVLSDMDTEIATLETKLAKYRKLKTGMMQQLLTGKIRLV